MSSSSGSSGSGGSSSSSDTQSIRYFICGSDPTPPELGVCVPCEARKLLLELLSCSSKNPIRYANGGVLLPQADLMVPQGDFFSHVRYYCNQASGPYDGLNGFNWWMGAMPHVVAADASVAVVFDPNNSYWFDQSGSDYVARYGAVGVSLVEDTSAHTLTFRRTSEAESEVTVFNDFGVWPNPGGLVSHTDRRGIVSTPTISSDGTTQELQRSYSSGGSTVSESLLYAYSLSGPSHGQLETVTFQRKVGSGAWNPVLQASYGYYGASDANGNLNDLQTAAQQLPDGMGGWTTVAVDYYRYYLGGEATGIVHGLKMHFGPEAYRLLFNAGIDLGTAADATVLPYADQYFEYDPGSGSVTKEIAAVCASCPGGGTTADIFAYTANPRSPAPGYNVWAMKTEQTLPDGSQIVVYTNYAGLPMLVVTIDPTATNTWATFYRYNSDGQLIWTAQPSAVNGYDDSNDDLLNYDSMTGLYEYLNDSSGLINVTNYYSTTGSGGVQDYVENENVREGQSGGDVLVRSYTYTSNIDAEGNAVYPVATDVSYPNAADPSVTITTSYSYTFYSGTNQISQKTTTLPVVSSGQNGSGTADTIIEEFDAQGNLTQRTDERGIVNDHTYADAVLGVVSEQTLNVQSGVTAPGVNVVTDFTYDDQGRLTQTLGPTHTVDLSGTATAVRKAMWNVYNQSAEPMSGIWGPDQTWTGMGYATGTGPGYTYSLIDPVSISSMDKNGRTTDQITSVRTTGSGALSSTDTFAQTDWQSWSSTQYDQQGHRVSQRTYFLIPSSGTGTVGTNYGETDYGYDALERQNRVESPVGTITRTVWTTPQWAASVWMGTDDTGATDSNPAGSGSPNNMVMITVNQYDGGSDGGDGNLTQVTQYASATDTRVTSFGYDFRDRKINMTGEIDVYAAYTYDNLDRLIQTDRYDTSSSGNLIGRSQTLYDDRGRVYQNLTYAVDPSTGTVGNALTSNTWYDPSSNTIQQIGQGNGQVFTKSVYNGVGWVTATYRGYNTSGTSYTQANTVSGDVIMSQSVPTYDEAGNVVSQAGFDRLNDAPATGSGSTGALNYASDPKARVSYSAGWFDGIDRSIASANYGAISSFTRPDTPPSSSSTVLVSSTTYDDAGRIYQTTDPNGIITQMGYDAAGRTTQMVEDQGGLNRTTNTAYTLGNQVSTLTAVNADTGDQITAYIYGTTLTDSDVARNDLLRYVVYPDSTDDAWSTLTVDEWADMTVPGWAELQIDPLTDRVAYTYNMRGQQTTITDQRGTVRSLYYDKLGRLTNDCVTTVGDDTDSTVLQIATTYEVRGMAQTITSYDNATPGSGTALNQVQLTYNTFSQLIEEQQEHDGSVSSSTPNVQYAYATAIANQIRPVSLMYPNGRVVGFDYGSTGGMNDWLSRVEAVQSDGSAVAQYAYLGASTVIRITYPQPSVWLDLWGGTSGTFDGFDQFNRIIDQRWQNSITGTPTDIDRYQYGYDQNSNRLWKANVVGTAAVGNLDEGYAYDNVDRLTQMQRGTLSGGIITGTPSREMDYTLDPTGNWNAYLTKASGTTDLNQTRSHNTVNEIAAIGGTPGWATPPAYDAAGNMNSFPQPAAPSSAFTAVYNAWNQMVSISDTGGTIATYQYDGRDRRIVKVTAATSETRHFYWTNNWQDIEERVGAATTMDNQYVWGIRYIDELICRDDATSARYYAMQDANFNLTAICDISGAVQERYLFDPYGNRTVMNASWTVLSASAYDWTIGHQGLMHDEECGLIYNRARYTQPVLGRSMGKDPIGYGDGFNLYEEERSSPINLLDPFGLAANSGIRVAGLPCCNGQKYDPNNLCCENGQVVAKVPIWRCKREMAGSGTLGNVGLEWGWWLTGWSPLGVFHEYLCCDGPNLGCFGDTEGVVAGGRIPREVRPIGNCNMEMICPAQKNSACNNPIAGSSYGWTGIGTGTDNCQTWCSSKGTHRTWGWQ